MLIYDLKKILSHIAGDIRWKKRDYCKENTNVRKLKYSSQKYYLKLSTHIVR